MRSFNNNIFTIDENKRRALLKKEKLTMEKYMTKGLWEIYFKEGKWILSDDEGQTGELFDSHRKAYEKKLLVQPPLIWELK